MPIWIDTETYSETPIKWGTYRYTSTCEPMVVTYAPNDGGIEVWDRTADLKMPGYLDYLLNDTDEPIVAHNAMFDRNVLKYGLGLDIPITRWRCNMVRALSHALPGGLDILCEILDVELDLRKQKSGKKLIHLFCKPNLFKHELSRADFPDVKAFKAAVAEAEILWTGRATRHTHPKAWAEFLSYAGNDISAMRALDKKLPRWNYNPTPGATGAGAGGLAHWHLDQTINDRGFLVDTDLAASAMRAVEREKKVLGERTNTLTNEEVESTTKRDQLLAHILREYGIDLPDMQMSTIERRVQDINLPPELRELLAIRLQASSTSTSKYKALLNAVMPDGRLRGTLQFAGAGRTRRHAGRTFQPQNLPSKGLPPHAEIELGIEAMKADCEDLVVKDVMAVASGALRGCIIAPPGKRLFIGDLANIEGRDAAWLAMEDWKLDAFRDFDTILGFDDDGDPIRKGPDLYKVAYARAFRVPLETVTKAQRQIGKVMELMLQYGGGVGAFVTGAATYGIDLEELAKEVYDTLPGDDVHEAKRFLEWTRRENRPTFGLSDEAFITCDVLKRLWRRAHPAISSLWKELEDAAKDAIEAPGNTFECRRFKVRRDGAWLRIQLPSGYSLCYPSPKIEGGSITYLGNNQYTRKWCRLKTYGGKLFENACQALAGDVLKANMPRIEGDGNAVVHFDPPIDCGGYKIILSVHDEIVAEAPDTPEYTVERLASLMATVPAWAEGLPLAAAGFSTQRYRKE